MEDEFLDVSDIDLELEKELGLDSTSEEEPVETEEEPKAEEEADVEAEAEETTEEETEPEKTEEKQEEPVENTKPTSAEKKEYSFAQLRNENKQLKESQAKAQKETEFLKEMAASYGYDDVDKFKEDYRVAKLTKEAQDKGVDPVLYRQNSDNERRIAQLENQLKQAELQRKTDAVKASIDSAVAEYNLGDDGSTEIFNRLEKAGVTVDYLLSAPNPDIIIKGVLIDKIAEASKQATIAKRKNLEDIADESLNRGPDVKAFNLDAFIDKELKDYDL